MVCWIGLGKGATRVCLAVREAIGRNHLARGTNDFGGACARMVSKESTQSFLAIRQHLETWLGLFPLGARRELCIGSCAPLLASQGSRNSLWLARWGEGGFDSALRITRPRRANRECFSGPHRHPRRPLFFSTQYPAQVNKKQPQKRKKSGAHCFSAFPVASFPQGFPTACKEQKRPLSPKVVSFSPLLR